MSATVLWDRPDRAVFFKPAGWEVYGAHTNRQMLLNCSECSGRLCCSDGLEDFFLWAHMQGMPRLCATMHG